MKDLSKDELVEAYLSHLLEHGKSPASIYRFCKDLGIEERQFYDCAPSFKTLEGGIWKSLFEQTHQALEADDDYKEYAVRQKLAAFYFTFLEVALNQRSFISLRFPGFPQGLACPSLKGLREAFESYVQRLVHEGLENGEVAKRGKLSEAYSKAFFAQWVFVIDFWLKDESEQFSRTDALVDKSVALAFDAVGSQVIDSAFDMLRFLVGRNTTV
jgi:hypothetical protein